MCNNTLLALLVFVVSVSCFADKPPQGTKCGIGTYGCKGYGADHCCSAYGYCGNTDAHCNPTLKTAPCKCDCIDGGVPCDNRDSTKVDYCKGPEPVDKKSKFISKIVHGAQVGWWDYGILPSLTIAQAILESGWGASKLALTYDGQTCNNLFGIKTGSNWKGGKCLVTTTEFYTSGWTTIKDYFRAYESWDDSVADHASFLTAKRYESLRGEDDYLEATAKIKEAGYATAPDYTQSLRRIIESNNLNLYDDCCDDRPDCDPVTSKQLYAKCCAKADGDTDNKGDGDNNGGDNNGGGNNGDGNDGGGNNGGGNDGGGNDGGDNNDGSKINDEDNGFTELDLVDAPDAFVDEKAIEQSIKDADATNTAYVVVIVVLAVVGAAALAALVGFAKVLAPRPQ